jgi:hypothetical protein
VAAGLLLRVKHFAEAAIADVREWQLRPILRISFWGSKHVKEGRLAEQVSSTFGSRQEETQRLARILRPKPGHNQAHFYTLVSGDTVEQEFALRRQLFLCEQGYTYHILDAPLAG